MNNKTIGLLSAGPALLLITLFTTPPLAGLSDNAWHICGLMAWMILWWVSEAVPIAVTSLLPMVLIPLLGVASMEATTAPYAHPLIFLFMGGFTLSIAMEKTGLHRRLALRALLLAGNKPPAQIASLMAVTAFLSMWMSNTATAVMMLPIGLSIIAMAKARDQDDFSKAILLAIAYSASIGGIATLIGTPPNALLAAFLADNYQIELSFARWMLLGLPLSVLMLICCWFWLCKVQFKLPAESCTGDQNNLSSQLASLGVLSRAEKMVLLVFILAATCWIGQQWLAHWTGLAISDTLVAMTAALLLFILPGKPKEPVLEWRDSEKLPWGILLLFGGGLTIAEQIQKTGVARVLAEQLQVLQGVEPLLVMLAVVVLILLLSEVNSNTATAAAFLPLLGPVAVSMGLSPLYLMVPAALAASLGFMLPVATPPNAIVFGSGHLKIKDMIRAGFVMNLVGVLLVVLLSEWLGPLLLP